MQPNASILSASTRKREKLGCLWLFLPQTPFHSEISALMLALGLVFASHSLKNTVQPDCHINDLISLIVNEGYNKKVKSKGCMRDLCKRHFFRFLANLTICQFAGYIMCRSRAKI